MEETQNTPNDFLSKSEKIILENLSNEQFGVSELAEALHMSRSNLLRKIKKATNLSASQYIRKIRLNEAMELLKNGNLNVSEVSYQVGFGSASYFIKCFREEYGYSPGEAGRKEDREKEGGSGRTRQLVAIMFTDIQGYTALMQKDEDTAIAYRERHREVFESATKKYNGRILQYYGDGTLSTFQSAVDAVQCAIEMQLAFTNEEPVLPIRVGIHSGDILVSDQDIIGDGVNVAARIESLSTAGSVYISDKVYDEVKNHPEFITASKGVHNLKNVTRAIEVYQVSNHELGGIEADVVEPKEKKTEKRSTFKWVALILTIVMVSTLAYFSGIFEKDDAQVVMNVDADKSIAVLPFINESNDENNLYFVNGLMESTLNQLQLIEDLRVISRTSSEKYRNAGKTLPEIATELNVSYIVEGSGQRAGDQVQLSIQLIDARNDQQIWSERFVREFTDIFELQNEIALKITSSVEAVITPAELERLEERPTENLTAYDYYLQAMELFHAQSKEGLLASIPLFEKAISYDNEFALAYANIAIAYYLLDMNKMEKQYTEKINSYSDQALLHNPKLASSLISKAFYYLNTNNIKLALSHFEKALEYNPNSFVALQMLADFYAHRVPNTSKYLEYALKGIQRNNLNADSTAQSYSYLSLSNALVQSGFFDEALKYVNLSLAFDSNNYYAPHLKAFVLFARDNDTKATQNAVIELWERDTSRMDILKDAAKMSTINKDFDNALKYADRFVAMRDAMNSKAFIAEDISLAYLYRENGMPEKAERFEKTYEAHCETDQTIYKSVYKALLHAYRGEDQEAIEDLKTFAAQDNFQYWFLLMDEDPLMESVLKQPQAPKVFKDIKKVFWDNHDRLKEKLESEGLI
ncbi:MAG: helix-turn-helix domain-containing protein [Bacteroidota bacterium]